MFLRRTFYSIALVWAVILTAPNVQADTLELRARVENLLKQPEPFFYSGDQGVYLWARAEFCINDDLPSVGKYYFKFTITAPNGQRTYVKTTAKRNVPTVPRFIKIRRAINMNFFRVQGDYTLTVSFVEEYPSINKTITLNKSYVFKVLAGHRAGGAVSAPYLLQPQDESIVSPYPNFQWTGPTDAYYNIYVSRNPNPELDIYWSAKGLDATSIIYPALAPALQPNVKYYWMVELADRNGVPAGGQNGKSQIFSLSTTPLSQGNDIALRYPNQLDIQLSMPTFQWSSAWPTGPSVSYTVVIAEEFEENIIWTGSTPETSYEYPSEAPQFKNGKNTSGT